MKAGELSLHRFVTIKGNSTAGEVLRLLDKYNMDYGILKKDEQICGYVTRQKLKMSEPNLLAKKCLQKFRDIIPSSSSIKVLENPGRTTENVFLLYEKPGEYIGILDFASLLKSIQHLEEQNNINNEEICILKKIIDFSSDEIYVTDGQGNTLLLNEAYEKNSGISREEVLGRNVRELEREGYFRPSVTLMVLEQKKKLSIFQEYANKSKVMVTGTPVFDTNGSIFRVIVNARDTVKLNRLRAQLEEIENIKERYYQELMILGKDLPESGDIIAHSSSMLQVLNLALKVAKVDATVLLLGETGVGKSLLARYIHDNSTRRKNLFVTINCGAIPENLLESELFGYEPGAFSGAGKKGKIGKIEMANGGTVFLDEIGDLPHALQVKLLHVLHEGTIMRIGGNKEIALNVRFLAATNRDLDVMVKEGCFREDLYYRLNVVPIEIPPLRERIADIVPLTRSILDGFNKEHKKNKTLSPAVLKCFQNYDWPGNIRELKNIIERFVIVVNEDIIEPYHLPEAVRMENVSLQGLGNIVSLKGIKRDVERKILEELYRQHKSTYRVAEILKVNQSTVARKIKRYNIKKT
ncbi:MAG: sigma 54-interacting transcriptional regulator [Firmicutes bacterium]|nr:sigma 54-interacting transcriptional regulator [Bacillota bacterium]